MVIDLSAANFKPLVLPMPGFSLSNCMYTLCLWSGPGGRNNVADVEKHDEHGLRWAATHSRLLRSWRWWPLPLRWLPLCLRVVPVHPRLVTGYDPGRERLSATQYFFCSGVRSQEDKLGSNTPHVQFRHYDCLHWPVWHANNISNVIHRPPTIRMHKFPNSFHIFGGDAHGSFSASLVFKGRSSPFEAPVPLKTLRTTQCLIAISVPKDVQCLCDQFAQFNAKF
jgi:hypothetical protein